MTMLDSPGFVPQVTPEVAISLVQKSIKGKGWQKPELSDLVLVYTPFYIFSFDIAGESGAPTGKAAINANTGELNEVIPALLDRPLQKSKKTQENVDAEVESTTINTSEVKEVAAIKIANSLGAKKENVAVSAVSKIYVPFYRLWVDVADDNWKVEIDACLGSAKGLESLAKREKTWDEVTGDTLKKMQSPSGIAELTGKAVGEMGKAATGKDTSSKYVVWIVLGTIILIVGFFAFQQLNAKVNCSVDNEFLSRPEFLGLFGQRKIVPNQIGDKLQITGNCVFSGKDEKLVLGQVYLKQGGFPVPGAGAVLNATVRPNFEITRPFVIEWVDNGNTGNLELAFDQYVG